MKHVDQFIEFARRRHSIWKARSAGLPKWQWYDDCDNDWILQQYRFTNVFRELDATTVWYRENVREKFDGTPSVFLATILFRWFNRIQTGEALFKQTSLWFPHLDYAGEPMEKGAWRDPPEPVAALWLRGAATVAQMRDAIVAFCGAGPYVTGAYIITSPAGMSKLDGVLSCCEKIRAREKFWIEFFKSQPSLEKTWSSLKEEKHMGPFMAYEVVTDLRHTHLLRKAPDIMTWANPGPGAKRGIMRIYGHEIRERGEKILFSTKQCVQIMAEILKVVNDHPLTTSGYWPSWEMRDVEHTLCEFDKYERVRTGLGRPRGVYK